MQYNNLNIDSLRTEIAILQHDVLSSNPGVAEFKIPALISGVNEDYSIIDGSNINNGKSMFKSGINSVNTIPLFIPTAYTYFYGKDIVPRGTKFIVSAVGGNINDLHIIGMYDHI